MSEVALYHPWIEPNDAGMLRTAAMFWDRLLSIVPDTITHPFQLPIAKEAAEAGFLRARIVSSDLPEVTAATEEYANDRHRTVVRNACRVGPGGPRCGTSRLHRGKVSNHIGEEMFGVADADGFYRVTRGEGSAYMSKLASRLAAADGITPFTDSEDHHEVLRDRICEEPSLDEDLNVFCEIAHLSLRTVGIRDDVPLQMIVDFRTTHRQLLHIYRGAIHKLTREVSRENLAPGNLGQRITGIVRDEIAPSVDELEAKLREGQLLSGISYIDIGQSCFIGLASSGFDNWQCGMLAGFVSLAINLFKNRLDVDATVRGVPYGYLLRARQRFSRQSQGHPYH